MLIETAGNVLLVVSALINLEMIYRYHRLTSGAWRDTPMGRHVMAFMGATALVLMLASARIVSVTWLEHSDPTWFQIARVATYAVLPVTFLWRRYLIIKAHRESEK